MDHSTWLSSPYGFSDTLYVVDGDFQLVQVGFKDISSTTDHLSYKRNSMDSLGTCQEYFIGTLPSKLKRRSKEAKPLCNGEIQ